MLLSAPEAQKDLIIDFKDGHNEFDDIQTLTNRISSFDEHLLDDIGGSTLFPRKLCCQRKNTNSDLSHYLRAREDILREIDAKSRSGSKCIGEERSHKSGSLPCLGFYNCMMIQDE